MKIDITFSLELSEGITTNEIAKILERSVYTGATLASKRMLVNKSLFPRIISTPDGEDIGAIFVTRRCDDCGK